MVYVKDGSAVLSVLVVLTALVIFAQSYWRMSALHYEATLSRVLHAQRSSLAHEMLNFTGAFCKEHMTDLFAQRGKQIVLRLGPVQVQSNQSYTGVATLAVHKNSISAQLELFDATQKKVMVLGNELLVAFVAGRAVIERIHNWHCNE